MMMTQEKEMEMFTELMQNYHEMYHEDTEYYNPESYEQYLDEMTDEEFIDEYNNYFGDNN